MKFAYNKLKGKIIEVCGTQAIFAEKMGLSTRTISLKMNGKIFWTQDEMLKACAVLGIPYEQVSEYFFAPIVQEAEQA